MIFCEFCDDPMKQMDNGDYSCVKCGQGHLPALPNGIGIDWGRGETFTPLLSHVAQLNTMLQKCEEVISQRETVMKERIMKAKRKSADSVVSAFLEAELTALEKLRKQVAWYRLTGTMQGEAE